MQYILGFALAFGATSILIVARVLFPCHFLVESTWICLSLSLWGVVFLAGVVLMGWPGLAAVALFITLPGFVFAFIVVPKATCEPCVRIEVIDGVNRGGAIKDPLVVPCKFDVFGTIEDLEQPYLFVLARPVPQQGNWTVSIAARGGGSKEDDEVHDWLSVVDLCENVAEPSQRYELIAITPAVELPTSLDVLPAMQCRSKPRFVKIGVVDNVGQTMSRSDLQFFFLGNEKERLETIDSLVVTANFRFSGTVELAEIDWGDDPGWERVWEEPDIHHVKLHKYDSGGPKRVRLRITDALGSTEHEQTIIVEPHTPR